MFNVFSFFGVQSNVTGAPDATAGLSPRMRENSRTWTVSKVTDFCLCFFNNCRSFDFGLEPVGTNRFFLDRPRFRDDLFSLSCLVFLVHPVALVLGGGISSDLLFFSFFNDFGVAVVVDGYDSGIELLGGRGRGFLGAFLA
jgi:hypothetical protein